MEKPQRIQLKRSKGWTLPALAKKVDRATKWGNPFRIGETVSGRVISTTEQAIESFRVYAERRAEEDPAWLWPLAGRDLACWCKEGQPCHGDVLISLANP